MLKVEKLYKIMSILFFVFHCLFFVLILIGTFMPYKADYNFYHCFRGTFGSLLPDFIPDAIHPYLLLCLPILACVGAFFSIRYELVSFTPALFIFVFFFFIVFPYMMEAAVKGLASIELGNIKMSEYQSGFYFFNKISSAIYVDFAFIIYAVISKLLVMGKQEKDEMENVN